LNFGLKASWQGSQWLNMRQVCGGLAIWPVGPRVYGERKVESPHRDSKTAQVYPQWKRYFLWK